MISSSFFFGLRVRLSGHSGDLHPGVYDLRRDMSYGAVIDALVKGPAAAKTINVTIPPGRAIRQTAARLRAAHIPVRGSYLAAARRSPLLNPVSYGAPRSTPNLEGFLFPDTYEIRVNSRGVQTWSHASCRRSRSSSRRWTCAPPRRKNLSAYDVLIIASMIEREADLDRERPLIAEVIYNRLKQGIPLGIDATTRYEINNFTRPLTAADFARNSPYNTRLNKDLPPTPIGNPGLASIQAAAHPAQGQATSTTWSSPAPAASTPSPRPTRSSSRTSSATATPARRRAGTRPRRAADRRSRLARRPQPLAGHARGGLRRARARRLALPAPARAARAVRRDDPRARRPPASWART